MLIEGVILGCFIGKLRGGRVINLNQISLRMWPLIILALVMQLAVVFFNQIELIREQGEHIYTASILLLVVCILFNMNKKGMGILLFGVLLNLGALYLNGFKIPIVLEGLKAIGKDGLLELIEKGQNPVYIAFEGIESWTKYLGKFITIPKSYPLPRVISIGDMFITFGLMILIQGQMLLNWGYLKNRMINMGYRGRI